MTTYPTQPNSPRDYCDRLGLVVDLSREGSPAVIGETGKRHYWPHGHKGAWGREMCDVLSRLARRKGV